MNRLRLLCAGIFLGCYWSVAAAVTDSVRQYLEALDAGAPPQLGTATLLSPQAVARFYREQPGDPIWVASPAAEARRAALSEAIAESAAHGFRPERYHVSALADPATPDWMRELLATDAYLTQARHRQNGAVDPRAIDPEWFLSRDAIDTVVWLRRAVQDEAIDTSLAHLWPRHEEYQALLQKRAQLAALPDADAVTVPPGPALKPGMHDARVALLKERLLGPAVYTPDYDKALEEAVKAFQLAAGLEPDGVVGTATLDVLNATHFSWVDRLDANLERWRWLPDALPSTYLRVNIAAFSLRAIRDGKDDYQMKVIVGKPFRRTPVFTETMKYLVYNPFWNVPTSIAVRDKLPLLQKDAPALAAQGYEARPVSGVEYVSVAAVNWAGVTRGQFGYTLRQRPGPANALGRIKFMLPNSHAVYLHDTPDHSLFQKQERGFSSGCVRLSDPLGLAHWVLNQDGQAVSMADVQHTVATQETRTVNLRRPLPVYIVYLTAFVNDQQDVVFRRDVYQRDQAIVDQLQKDF